MRSRVLTLVACALAGVLAASVEAVAQPKTGGPAAPNPRIRVTLTNAVGDRIVSDLAGAYADCDAVAPSTDCAGLGQIWAGGSEDATFRMAAGGPRRFHAYCGDTVSGAAQCGGEFPGGYSPDGWFLNVRGIGAMPYPTGTAAPQPQAKEATFSVDGDQGGSLPQSSLPLKRFNWMGTTAQRVEVTRTSATRWVVTASVSSGTAVGANALLEKQVRKGFTAIGTYSMPFSLVIECIRDCNRLTVP